MADLDPFGRRKGEDPLASLGWSSEGATDAEPVPESRADEPVAGLATDPEPPKRSTREPRPTRQRESKERSQAVRAVRGVVLLGIVVVVAGSAIASFVSSGVDKVERFVDDLTTPQVTPATPEAEVPTDREQPTLAPPPAPPAKAAVPAGPPVGLGRGSLLRPYAFGAALRKLRNGGFGRLTNLRVAPERIDATLLTKAGALRHLQIVPGGAVRQFGTGSTGFSGVPTMSLQGISAAAPQRLTRAAAERAGIQPSRVNYLVYTQFAGTTQWNVYFKGGQIFSADASGRITRRVS